MLTLRLENGQLSLREAPLPVPRENEALIRVLKTAICRTDIELARGYMEFRGIPGHEFVGEVVRCEEGEWAGQRVVGEINLSCGRCSYCREGMDNHCPERSVLGIQGRDGTFAEFLALPLRNLHRVPDAVSDIRAVFTEPLAAALRILEQIAVTAGDRVLVLGDGKMGLLIAQVMRMSTPHVMCVGNHERKLNILKDQGIGVVYRGERPDGRFDIVVEATGNRQGLAEALSSVRPEGRIVLKSTYSGDAVLDASRLVVDEIQLIGSRCGPFKRALRVLETGPVDVESLVDGDYPLEEGEEAFRVAQESGVMKILLTPPSSRSDKGEDI